MKGLLLLALLKNVNILINAYLQPFGILDNSVYHSTQCYMLRFRM